MDGKPKDIRENAFPWRTSRGKETDELHPSRYMDGKPKDFREMLFRGGLAAEKKRMNFIRQGCLAEFRRKNPSSHG